MSLYSTDIELLKDKLLKLPKTWDGKQSVLELKAADYNWGQMEWWAFYFEHKVKGILKDDFSFPGDKINNVRFDLRGKINWDLKASAIKTDSHKIILNDQVAMDKSVAQDGFHGEIIALCDVEYNDKDRSFQHWHTALKGGKSDYQIKREERTSISRYRKTKAELTEIVLLVFTENDLAELAIVKQGRNSNGKARPPKYMLDLESIDNFENHILKF